MAEGVQLVDSQFMIWGLKSEVLTSEEKEYTRARLLFEALPKTIQVPAPALAEAAVRFQSDGQRDAFYERVSREFIVRAFDAKSARIASKIMAQTLGAKNENWHREQDATRKVIKFDAQILSIGISIGAARLWTRDSDFKRLTEMAARAGYSPPELCGINDVPRDPQNDLFESD